MESRPESVDMRVEQADGGTYVAMPPRKACIACRTRKVKCDRAKPCSTCIRTFSVCKYPSPFRSSHQASVKVSNEPDPDLLQRISNLEGAVKELGGFGVSKPNDQLPITREYGKSDSNGAAAFCSHCGQPPASKTGRRDHCAGHGSDSDGNSAITASADGDENISAASDRGSTNVRTWSNSQQVTFSQRIGADSGQQVQSTGNTIRSPVGFPFGMAIDLQCFHPPLNQVSIYWQHYLENVDPIIEILHRRTVEKTVANMQEERKKLEKPTEALLFAIYFAVTVSMNSETFETTFKTDRATAMAIYRQAVQQALMNADFMSSHDFVTLQALVVFLMCLRQGDDTKLAWSLVGTATRIAQSLSLHRDGSKLGFSPFMTEMRRRLWWQICLLGELALDDTGSDIAVQEPGFDVELPLNINDSDLDPEMEALPAPRNECTQMTFSLVCFEFTRMGGLLRAVVRGNSLSSKEARNEILVAQDEIIKQCHDCLERRYLQRCRDLSPIFWLTENLARMVIAKCWLMLHDPLNRPIGDLSLSAEMRDRMYLSSIQIVEKSRELATDSRSARWRWLVGTYFQWLPLGFIMAELCVRTSCSSVPRAWRAVDDALQNWTGAITNSCNGDMLRRLYAKAKTTQETWILDSGYSQRTQEEGSFTHSLGGVMQGNVALQPQLDTLPSANPSVTLVSTPPSIDFPHFSQLSEVPPWNLDTSAVLNGPQFTDASHQWKSLDDLLMEFDDSHLPTNGNWTSTMPGQWWSQ